MGLFLWSPSPLYGEWFFIFLLHLFSQGCTSRRIIETYLAGGGTPIMAYTGRLHPKGLLSSGFRYIKG